MTLADEAAAKAKREQWSNTHELLAVVVELLSLVRRESLAVAGVKAHDLPEPVHIDRPGAKPKKDGVPVMTPRQFARAMAAQGV